MRIVVDLQACQSHASRNRGIGRYSMALLKAMLRNAGEDEVLVALNGELPGTVEPIRAALNGLLPQDRILVWTALPAISAEYPDNDWRRAAAAEARQHFLESLRPDVVHVTSWFEGFIDDTLTSPGAKRPRYLTAATLYDLIPLVHPKVYLKHPRTRAWYQEKSEELGRADLLLGISEHSCREAGELLGTPAERLVNISAAIDPMFRPLPPGQAEMAALRSRYGLSERFLMYTGGIDPRKNVEGLIQAYARLPAHLRYGCQLAVVCSANTDAIARLQKLAASEGLEAGQLVMTGYVGDADLVALYNTCDAFVFPSWHEGFGLPVLEAMACGAAVIAANTSSLPEVMDCDEAMFDPHQRRSITTKMEQVLTDSAFRERLRQHGLRRAATFSWEQCAQRALAAMREAVAARASAIAPAALTGGRKPLLAYISPLPPQPSGVADYGAELLPALSEYYRIEAISDQTSLSDPWLRRHVRLRSTAWFEEHAHRYDRVLYHISNGLLHAEMLLMLERHPGTVVLHELFLSGITSHLEWASKAPGYWTRSLYESHGYAGLLAREAIADSECVLERYPCSLPAIRDARGIIVHSRFMRELADRWFGEGTSHDWTVIPHLRAVPKSIARAQSRRRLRLSDRELLVCCFGILGPFKRNREIIEGWLASRLATDKNCRLVFVGGSLSPTYDDSLRSLIADSGAGDRITITGWVDRPLYRDYLAAADVAVQLRGSSRGEASGTVHDCLAHGVATIVNAHGPFNELPSDAAWVIPDDFSSHDLANALQKLAGDATLRRTLGERGRAWCRAELEPSRIAALYHDAIERAGTEAHDPAKVAEDIARVKTQPRPNTGDLARLAAGIANNQRTTVGVRQLLVDVSELARRDSRSGIQRVVRSVLSVLLANPPAGYRVEPVYAEPGQRYRYARKFVAEFLDLAHTMPPDEPIDTDAGDVFLGLDLALPEITANAAQFENMRDRGASVYFVVYDQLPLVRSDCFPEHAYQLFDGWVKTFARIADGAICISKAVSNELERHLDALQVKRERPFKLGYFHLGADIDSSRPSLGITPEESACVGQLRDRPSFLVVGTIEPRKGHTQTLDAFERLWAMGSEVVLVLVGKPGWMTDVLVQRLREHREIGHRLFWFETASDELLKQLYACCSALLAPSEAEGFGLPLIEAAQHGLPILCRDLPVFREVAGEHASYFSGWDAEALAAAISDWLIQYQQKTAPSSNGMRWLTWQQSADQLLEVALCGTWDRHWLPGERLWFPAYEPRITLPAGRRERGCVVSNGRAGVILQTWRFAVPRGRYRMQVRGEWLKNAGCARLELATSTSLVAQLNITPGSIGRGRDLLDAMVEIGQEIGEAEMRIVVSPEAHLAIEGCGLEEAESSASTVPTAEPSGCMRDRAIAATTSTR